MQGGLEYFTLALLLMSSLSQALDSIESVQVPDWMSLALVLVYINPPLWFTLTHPSHPLNVSGAQSVHCWVCPSGFGSARSGMTVVEIIPLQSVMPGY